MSGAGMARLEWDDAVAHSLSLADAGHSLLLLTIYRSESIRLKPVSGRPGALFGSNWHGRPSAVSR
jgi:hypothetical protein